MFPCKKCRGRHYLQPGNTGADREAVKHKVKAELNFRSAKAQY